MGTEQTPENWPPRPGDVWRDADGDVWFAVHFSNPELDEDEAEYEELVCSRADGCEPISEDPEDVASWHGPLTLVWRNGGGRG